MPTSFSRTMRSLDTDGFHNPLWRLLLLSVLLGSWIAWFFFAQVTLYDVSEAARLVDDNLVVADFPSSVLGRIRPGQPARLRLDSFRRTQDGTISATVAAVALKSLDEPVQVTLLIHKDPSSSIPFQRGLTGVVEIEIEHVSPATLVLHLGGP